MRRKISWEKIEKLVLEWYDTPQEGNQAVRKKLENDVFVAIFQQYTDADDPHLTALGKFFEEDWPKFDPNMPEHPEKKRSFKNYFFRQMKRRVIDVWNKDHGLHQINGQKAFDTSLDTTITDDSDDEMNLHDVVTDPKGNEEMDQYLVSAQAFECVSLMLGLSNRLKENTPEPSKIRYFRMFFTDGVVDYLHSCGERAFLSHERDVFRAMKIPFLDFFMQDSCRSFREIMESKLKLYGEMVDGEKMVPITEHPLPLEIHKAYLAKEENVVVSIQAISQYKKPYRIFMEKGLCLQDSN